MSTSTEWRQRIVGTGTESPADLLANPKNWRIHPAHQQRALTAVLERVGWVQDVIVNQTTGFVLDGHLRVSLAISNAESSIPVSYVELTDAEEDLVLAAIDTTTGLAESDSEALDRIFEADTEGELQALFSDEPDASAPTAGTAFSPEDFFGGQGNGFEPVDDEDEDADDGGRSWVVMCPECGHEFSVVVHA